MSRAIRHAFDALEALNRHEALRISEFARVLDLPRSTTVRAVRALESMNYIERRGRGERYVLTQRALRLASGYGETNRLVQVARPILDGLCAETGWPLALVLPRGLGLRVYYTTDDRAPRKIFASTAGGDLPLRDSASGVVYLAHCDDATRRLLLDAAAIESPAVSVRRSDSQLQADLTMARRCGYFFQGHSHVVNKQFDGFQSRECVLALPLQLGPGRVIGVLAARLLTRAVSRELVATALLPRLRQGVAEIEETAARDCVTSSVAPAASCVSVVAEPALVPASSGSPGKTRRRSPADPALPGGAIPP